MGAVATAEPDTAADGLEPESRPEHEPQPAGPEVEAAEEAEAEPSRAAQPDEAPPRRSDDDEDWGYTPMSQWGLDE